MAANNLLPVQCRFPVSRSSIPGSNFQATPPCQLKHSRQAPNGSCQANSSCSISGSIQSNTAGTQTTILHRTSLSASSKLDSGRMFFGACSQSDSKFVNIRQETGVQRNRGRRPLRVECKAEVALLPLRQLTPGEPAPVYQRVKAFAPATVANLGPGFDFLGCAVQGLGDHVIAELSPDVPGGQVSIKEITGDGGKLSLVAEDNCVGIAARATLELLGVRAHGVTLTLHKGLPLGSGLGSSAASAAAAAVAVNALFGDALTKDELVEAGLRSEAAVSGYHADNVGPAILGGFVLIRSYDPLEILRLPYPEGSDLFFVVASPAFEAPTKAMRAALPTEISMKAHVANSSQAGALVAAILTGDAQLLGSALASDKIVEPRRGLLIPGCSAVKVAASAMGAYGCTISGAGPTSVAITDSLDKGKKIGEAMVNAFLEQGKLQATVSVQPLDRIGARVVEAE